MKTNNNSLIDEFMGFLPKIKSTNYHNDWNKLMEVVEKIEITRWDITQTKPYLNRKESFKGTTSLCGEFIIGYDDREELKGWTSYVGLGTLPSITIKDFENRFNTKIEAVYTACVEFIKWYNENRAKEN